MTAVRLFNNMFYNAPTRVGRFRDVYESSLEKDSEVHSSTAWTLLQNRQNFSTTEFIEHVNAECSTTFDDVESAVVYLETLATEEKATAHVKSPKLSSDTRWLHSTWECYVFFRDNFEIIYKFVEAELLLSLATGSVFELGKLFRNESTRKAIVSQLEEVIATLYPYATYLKTFSDFSTRSPTAHLVHVEDANLEQRLGKISDQEVRECALQHFREWKPGTERQQPLWEAVRYLVPAVVHFKFMASKMDENEFDQNKPTSRHMRNATGISFPDSEWCSYLNYARKKTFDGKPHVFWEVNRENWPELSGLALSLLWL
eukprot:PhM_4_TR17362/c0_g1_i1/m.21581